MSEENRGVIALRPLPEQTGVFIHIPKVAGTTVYMHTHPNAPRMVWKHGTALAVSDYLEGQWKSYFSFAFVRNPFERIVSWFLHMKQYVPHMITFEDYCNPKKICFAGTFSPDLYFRDYFTQKSYLTDVKGNVLVDFIGRMENFDEDFGYICDKLEIPKKYKSENVSKSYDYREFFTDELREQVTRRCQWEIEKYGYTY